MPTDEVIKSRIADYLRQDPAEEKRKLVALWQSAHPEAKREQPSYTKPLVCVFSNRPPSPDPPVKEPDEQWTNDTYFVSVRRWQTDRVFGTRGGMIQIGIASLDGTARHDWRDFQAIKNQLAYPECEAFELYPAESRLLDPSNYYTLWCFPGVKRLKIGVEKRDVLQQDEAIAPQRAFARDGA